MERFNVNSCTKFSVIEELNSEFTLCKCYVMASGKNRNMSYFDKKVVIEKLNSLNYAPVVAHLFKDENGKYVIGGHDYTFDDNWNYVSLCVPFGVVKADTYNWEIVNEYGTDVEYLTAQVILWTGRYPELKEAIYSDDIWFNQSMEVNVNQYRPLDDDSNYLEILDFEFSALCLLNKSDEPSENVEPCFISAKITPYNFNADEFVVKMDELKQAMNKCFNLQKEGEELENIIENIQDEISDTVNEIAVENDIIEISEGADVNNTTESIVDAETENTENTNTNSTVEEVETIDYSAAYQEAQTIISSLQEDIKTLKAEIDELRVYKDAVEAAERKKAEDEVFSKYETKIGNTDEFEILKANSHKYSIEELNRECLLLVGMYAMNCTAQDEIIKFSVITDTQKKTSQYGDVFEKYGNR